MLRRDIIEASNCDREQRAKQLQQTESSGGPAGLLLAACGILRFRGEGLVWACRLKFHAHLLVYVSKGVTPFALEEWRDRQTQAGPAKAGVQLTG